MYDEGGASGHGEGPRCAPFTRLERDLIKAVETTGSPYAAGFAAQATLARVIEREYSGTGFVTTVDIERHRCPPLSEYRGVEGALVGWVAFHVEAAGLEHGLHARIVLRDGYFRQIEGIAYGDVRLDAAGFDRLVASSIEIV